MTKTKKNFVLSNFRVFVINPFGLPDKRDLRFAPTGLSGLGFNKSKWNVADPLLAGWNALVRRMHKMLLHAKYCHKRCSNFVVFLER